MDTNKLNFEELNIWQDKEIKFDITKKQLALRVGEKIIDNLDNIEDTKGFNGDIGTMLLTNLRLIWYCKSNVKINLTIGYDCIVTFEIKQSSSKVIGDTSAIYFKCRYNNNRFEFVFNSLTNTDKIFNTFSNIYKAYDASRLYREIKIKGFITQDKNLIILQEEKLISKFTGASNIQNETAINGIAIITNIRIAWYSINMDNLNFSLPWIQIKNIKIKDNIKFGRLIVFELNKHSGSNLINLKLPSNENIDIINKELLNYHIKFFENPLLGVDFNNLNIDQGQSNKNEVKNNQNNNEDKNKLSIITEINESKLDYTVSEFNSNSSKKIENKDNKENMNINNNIISEIKNKTDNYNIMLNNQFTDDIEIIQTNYFNEHPAMLNYLANNQEKKNTVNDIVFCPELGMSIERLPDNVSIDNLWKIIMN
jgi:Bardet-Biedl syndrome 5 protein